jgi:hypothetical protein
MSERARHTAGPWEWWTSNSWLRLRHSDHGVSTNVLMPVVLKDGQATIDVSQADMALIAAAPEMLAALKATRLYVETLEKHLDPTINPVAPTIREHGAMLRAAIAKAESHQP